MSKRLDTLLKAKEHIKEYIVANVDDLLKLKNGAVIVETACQDLGILDNPTMVELANAVWAEVAREEIARIQAKEALRVNEPPTKISGKVPATPLDTPPERAIATRLAELFQQQQREYEEALAVFGDAIEYLTVKLSEPPPSIWEQIKCLVKAKLRMKSKE